MTTKRGRPYGYQALADLQVGEVLVVKFEDWKRADTTRKTLAKKRSQEFDAKLTDDGNYEYKRVA